MTEAKAAAAKAKKEADAKAKIAAAKAAEIEAAAAKAAALEDAKSAAKQALEVKVAAIAKRKAAEAEVQAAKQAEMEYIADFEEAAAVAAAAKAGSEVPYFETLVILQETEEVKTASAALTELAEQLAENTRRRRKRCNGFSRSGGTSYRRFGNRSKRQKEKENPGRQKRR